MKIEFHRDMQNPQTIEVTRVLILDNFNNPLAIAVEVEHGIIILETANEPVKLNAVAGVARCAKHGFSAQRQDRAKAWEGRRAA